MGTISAQVVNVDHVSSEYFDITQRHIKQIIQNSTVITTELERSHVDLLQINVGNITTTAIAVRSDILSFKKSDDNGEMRWKFSGENQLRSVTLQVGEKTWQEEFARLRLPTTFLLNGKADLKMKAHQAIYERLCLALTPVDRAATRNTIILQGASGLGKTHCAQHYFYHKAAQRHKMVAWLTATSQEVFVQGWRALAHQLRVIDTENRSLSDDAIIQEWCENKLGHWLFIIDEVAVEAEWLAERLPKKGGHVVITTHFPHYPLSPHQIILPFSPLSSEDSQLLLQAFKGDYWQVTGHPKEAEALEYLCSALGGLPVALTQMALLAHKKVISFERLANQFKQSPLRAYLLNDVIYDQVSSCTFISSVEKGRQQLFNYLIKRYPQLSREQHEQHLSQFVGFLLEQVSTSPSNYLFTDDEIQEYWQAISISHDNISFDIYELMNWLGCLSLFYDSEVKQWHLSLAGISALQCQNNNHYLQPLISLTSDDNSKTETMEFPKLPTELHVSIDLKNTTLRDVHMVASTVNKPGEIEAWQLPTINDRFIPRDKLIEDLKQKLPIKKEGESSTPLFLTAAATGMGGIGKTELARYFITKPALSSHYQQRFWFTAASDSQMRLEFHQLASHLRLIEPERYVKDEELIEHIHKWLSIHPGWLMVLDNADDYNSIARWVPKTGGAVLVTTREPSPGTLLPEQIVPVPLLTSDEAVQWLYELSGRNLKDAPEQEVTAATSLVEKLGFLPLAVAQAAAYLRVQDTASISDYQNFFMDLLYDTTLAEHKDTNSLKKDPDAYSRLVVANTWTISLRAIEAYVQSHNMLNMSEPLLTSCAYLAPKDIPVILLEHWLKNLLSEKDINLASYMLDEYIGQLVRYSLIERDDVKNTLSIHRLVQEVFQFQQSTENKLSILKTMCSISDEVIINNDGLDVPLDRLLLPHAEILYQYSEALCGISKVNNREKAEKIWKHVPKQLGMIYNHLGLSKKGKDFFENIVPLFNLYYGDSHIEALRMQNNLAIFVGRLGDDLDALERYQGLARKIAIYYQNEDHIDIAGIQQNIAYAFEKLGNYANAKILYENSLKIAIAHYQTESHLHVADIQQNLAVIFKQLGDYYAAKILYEKALATIIAHYQTESHIHVAGVQQNLANTFQFLGHYIEARTFYEKALVTMISHYQTEAHIYVAGTQQNLARVFERLGAYDEAKALYEKALAVMIEYYQTDRHIYVAGTQQNLALTLERLQDLSGAEQLLKKSLETKKAYYHDSHIEIAHTKQDLAIILARKGNHNEAKTLFQNVLADKIKYYQTELHIDVADVQQNLALTLAELGEYLREKLLLEISLSTKITCYKNVNHLCVGDVQYNLVILLLKLGHLSEGKKLLQKCEEIFRTQPGGEQYLARCDQLKKNLILAFFSKQSANEMLSLGYYAEAVELYKSLVNLCSADPSCYHNAACAYYLLGLLKAEDACLVIAQSYFEKSLSLSNRICTQVEYANFLRARGDYTKALIMLNNAIERNNEDDSDVLSYGLGEAIVLPHALAEKVRAEGKITIKNPIFFAHYLIIVCLLEQPAMTPIIISESLNTFSNFSNAARNNHSKYFSPIYDWFLHNAQELSEKQQPAATCIQRFFRGYITRKILNSNEIRVNF